MTTKLNETLGKLKNIPILSSLPNLPKKVIWVIIVSIVVLAGAGGGYAYYQSTQTADESTSTSELQTAMATRGDLVIYASGTGTLVSANETELSFTSTGKVTEVNVTVGEKVEAGTQLAKLDDTDAQATYAEANRAYLELTSPSAIATAQ
ncbi:MAG TPA: biotin/lipoyl-binding protein, partial [Anaerolineales bacterium]|nr:biotin/lipoyl-binding protein [Anaerolineales bacterium]